MGLFLVGKPHPEWRHTTNYGKLDLVLFQKTIAVLFQSIISGLILVSAIVLAMHSESAVQSGVQTPHNNMVERLPRSKASGGHCNTARL